MKTELSPATSATTSTLTKPHMTPCQLESTMATMCPKFKTAVHKVMAKHTAKSHFMEGGKGVCCYVWVSGPGVTPKGKPSVYKVKDCFGSIALDLTGTLDADLKAIPGYVGHHIYID
jgi:hypothetical protein